MDWNKDNIIRRKEELLRQIKTLSEKFNLFIVGAGKYGGIVGKWLNQNAVKWKGYLDRSKDGQTLNGKTIFNTYTLKDESGYFIIPSYKYQNEMKADLLKKGISDSKIILIVDIRLLVAIYEDTDNWTKYTERNKKFFKCHENDNRCFIIGNGPSLKIEDLEMLTNEITFASNTIYGVYGSTNWRPKYYCSLDAIVWDTLDRREIIDRILLCCDFAFASAYGKAFQYKDDVIFEKLHYVMPMSQINEDTQYPFFSENGSMLYICGTVTYAMIQLAVYMGFKQIYLLGMDFIFSHERHTDNSVTTNNVVNHMEQVEKEQKRFYGVLSKIYGPYYMASIDEQRKAYMSAKQYADTHGIKIYNATRGGALEVFERVDFDSLFNN